MVDAILTFSLVPALGALLFFGASALERWVDRPDRSDDSRVRR